LENGPAGAIVQRKVAGFVYRFESDMGKDTDVNDTPQKSANKKKARKEGEDLDSDTVNDGSAASFEEDRRAQ
jgi:hypothetical protein